MFLLLLLDADCSGRTLATLLVVWVASAMVASILLRWEYMWIVLAVLTLLFLLVCGYLAYNAKKAYMRALLEQRAANARERREREIWTVAGVTADNRGEGEACANYLISDLPPSYASIVLAQGMPVSSDASLPAGGPPSNLKSEQPPSYSTVISSIEAHERNAVEVAVEPSTVPTPKKSNATSASVFRTRDS